MVCTLLSNIYKTFDYIKTKISENRLFKLTIQISTLCYSSINPCFSHSNNLEGLISKFY